MKLIKKLFLIVLVIGLLALGVLLSVDNQQMIQLRFLDWQTPAISLYFWLLIFFAGGFLLGALLTGLSMMRQGFKIRSLEGQLKNSRQQLQNAQSKQLAESAWERASP